MWYIFDFANNRSINTCLWYRKLSYRRDLQFILKQKKTFSYHYNICRLHSFLPLRLHCHVIMLYSLIQEKNMLEKCRIKLKTYELAT